jgi:phosphoglycerate dehydrogenase-like enzyme
MHVLIAFLSPNTAWVLPRVFVERLREEFPQHTFVDAWDQETLDRVLPDADVAFTAAIDRKAFANLPKLQWVQSPAAGVGGMMSDELAASPVIVTSARGIRARAIAEHVLAVTLALARQLHVAILGQREHRWALDEIEDAGAVRTVRGRQMTIVGLGSIGVEVARLARPVGFRVAATRRRVDEPLPPGVMLDEIAPPDRLFDLLAKSDVVVLSTALTPATRNLINREALDRVKRGAYLVNVGRGKLVDDDAVIEALKDGRLGGAALDVFTREPLDPDSPYWDLPNVIITPHMSGAMEDYWTPLVALFADNLRRFERGQPLRNVVDKTAGY